MNLLNILLDTSQSQGGSPWSMIIMLVLMGVVFYFFMIKPQQKRQKELNEFRAGIQKGDKVMTVGGIHGVVADITDTTVILSIAQDVNIAVEKTCVVADNTDMSQTAN